MSQLHGCIPIVVTPFLDDGSIDEESLRTEVEYLIAAGVHGLATPAIASEGYKLSEGEQAQVAAAVIEQVDGRVPVVVSADGNGTDVAVARACRMVDLGATALMVLPPSFMQPDAENLFRYYARIAAATAASGVEIMVQDAPQLTGVAIPPSLLVRLNREHPTIASVKLEGTPAGYKTADVIEQSGGRIRVFAGWGGLSFWEGLQRGAVGCMPAPNFGPQLALVYNLFRQGEVTAARHLFDALTPFITWSMQAVDLSVWCAKEEFVRRGLLRTAVLREPATLPDAVMRTQFAQFFAAHTAR